MPSELRSSRDTLMWFIGLIVAAYAALCAYLFVVQRSMIYYPTPESAHSAAEDLRIDTEDAILQVWRVGEHPQNAVLYFGGNAEDVAGNIDEFAEFFDGHTVYLANYRGYGASSGSPHEQGILRDAESLFDEVSSRHEQVTVIGRSLGSGVAVHVGTSREVERLVLITPYDSLASVAAGRFPILPVSLLIRDRYDSLRLAALIDTPTLVLAAEYDEVIPIHHARNLAESIRRDLLEFIVIDGAGHNTIGEFTEYRDALIRFVRRDDQQI